MQSALEQLRKQIEDLGRQLQDVQERVQRLESDAGTRTAIVRHGRHPAEVEAGAAAMPAPRPGSGVLSASSVTLVGRTLVVLGGAYLIRALSDRELVPPLIGAGTALLYATGWLLQSARSAARGQRTSALFHGVTGLAIAYPLVWETTLVFELVGVPVASAVLVALLLLGTGVARRSKLDELAWGVVLAHVTSGFALMIATHDFLSPTLALLASALALEFAAVGDRWLPLRWPIALGTDLALCMLVSSTLHHIADPTAGPPLPIAGGIAALLALPSLYLGSIGVRTLLRAKPITIFEMVQAAASLLVAFVGAVRIQLAQGGSPVALGAVALLLGAGCYAAAFAAIDRRLGRGRNFYAYTSLALLLALAGWPLLLPGAGAPLAIAWSVLAGVAVGAGVSFDRITLRFHGCAYALAMSGASGLLAAAGSGLVGDPTGALPLSPVAAASVIVPIACCAVLLATRAPQAPWYERLPLSLLAAVVAGSLAGLAARSVTPWLLDVAPAKGTAAVAAARTVLISATAVGLAWAGRRWNLRELHWPVAPVLVGGAAKLLWEDLPMGEPVALFVALGAYGGALIATPRLLRGSA